MAAYVTVDGTDYPVIFDPPGEQTNILQLTEGIEPTSLKYYGVLEGDPAPDRFITYANLIKYLLLRGEIRVGSHTVTAGANTLLFKVGGTNTPLASNAYAIILRNDIGLGISNVNKTGNGITFDSIDAGTIDYIAILNT